MKNIVIVGEEAISRLDRIDENQRIILEVLKNISLTKNEEYLTVKEFMQNVKIARSKFDELVAEGKVRTVRPNGGRKIYVPVSEVTRFFEGE